MGEETPSYKALKELVTFYLADVQSQNHIKNLSLTQTALPAVKPDAPKQKPEDCKNWSRKGKCPKRDSNCPFIHDPAKQGAFVKTKKREESRGRSPTPTPKGNGKGRSMKGSRSPRSNSSASSRSDRGTSPKGKNKKKTCCKDWKTTGSCKYGENADFGIHQHASSTQKGAARREIPAHTPIGLAESIHQKQTSLQRDSL